MISKEEIALLKKEVEELRNRLKELGEGEGEQIPFLDYTNGQKELHEVNLQT